MAEIIGLGLSHYPGIAGKDEAMADILRNTLQRPDIPPEAKDPRNWPIAMQKEWGEDEGRGAAPRHREQFVEHLRVLRAELDAFKPDVVVMWGDDQYENFHEDIIPPFCIYAYEDMRLRPHAGRGEQLVVPGQAVQPAKPTAPNIWGEDSNWLLDVAGHRSAAKHLTRELLRQKIDVSYSYEPLHYKGLSHAFFRGILYLDHDRQGFPYPLVPFAVNCYGNRVIMNRGGRFPIGGIIAKEDDLDPPSPTPQRCMEVGAATARALLNSDWRVALVASSSWSHAFLTAKHSMLYPDVEADRRLYEALERGDYDYWRNRTLEDVVESGQQEVLNWYCLLGAMEELGMRPSYTGFVESYVMNSNKCFAVFKP